MKKINLLFTITIWFFGSKASAQITQMEMVSGITKTDFTYYAIKPLDNKKAFSVSTLTFFQKYHNQEDTAFDELGVQINGFSNICKSIAIGPSLYHNSVAGFSERLSIQFSTNSDRFIITVIPSVAHMELTDNINGELFMQIQFIQPIKEQWNFAISSLILTHWDKFSKHARSFQQVRIGLLYNSNQFGFAADFDNMALSQLKKPH